MSMFFFNPDSNRDYSQKEFSFVFFVLGEGQRGIKGVNARAQNFLLGLCWR